MYRYYINHWRYLFPYWPPATLPCGEKTAALGDVNVDLTSFATELLPPRQAGAALSRIL